MDLDELRAVQTRERATDGLQDLRESFYADVATYIQELREERERRAADAEDPFRDPKVTDLTDEIEVAEQLAEAIYERRIGKLVKQASLAAAGMPDDQTGLTAEEQDLYTDLVERIRENKEGVLDVIAGEAPIERDETETPPEDDGGRGAAAAPTGTSTRPHPESETDPGTSAEAGPPSGASDEDRDSTPTEDRDDRNGGTETDQSPEDPDLESDREGEETAEGDTSGGPGSDDSPEEESAAVERTTVVVTEDVGEIFGVDGQEYSLYEDDVVELPVENAAPLVERDAAEELE